MTGRIITFIVLIGLSFGIYYAHKKGRINLGILDNLFTVVLAIMAVLSLILPFDLNPLVNNSQPVTEETGTFEWNGEPIAVEDFYKTGTGTYQIDSSLLIITGLYANDRVWLENELPENVSIKVTFTPTQESCKLIFGLGDGKNPHPEFYVNFSPGIKLGWTSADDTNQINFDENSTDLIAPNFTNTVTFIRQNGELEVLGEEGSRLVRARQTDFLENDADNPNSLNHLWLYSGFPGYYCTTLIRNIVITELD